MPDPAKGEEPTEEIENIQDQIGELVRRALIQVGDLQDVEEKLRDIVEKSSRATPPPEPPPN
jgi:hypothetical protein